MQYQNKRNASVTRAVIKTLYAVLSIGAIFSFLGEADNLTIVGVGCVVMLVVVFILANLGGFCELSLQADESYVELRSFPIFASKGHTKTYSIFAKNLVSYRYVPVLCFHYLSVNYIGHNGKVKTAHIGLTLSNAKMRRQLIKVFKNIMLNNAEGVTVNKRHHYY